MRQVSSAHPLQFENEPIQEALPFLRNKSTATNHSVQRLDIPGKPGAIQAFETESKRRLNPGEADENDDVPFDPSYDEYAEQNQYFKEQFEVIHEDQSLQEERKTVPQNSRHVSSFQDKVQQSKSIIYQGDEGGIVTFAKHRGQPEEPTRQAPPQILINPNYVAERTSQIINEISMSQRSVSPLHARTQHDFYQHDSLHGDESNFRSTGLVNKRRVTKEELMS